MASLDILCFNSFNLKNKVMKIEHKEMLRAPSKILKDISWPINICLKYFMAPQKPSGHPSYILNVRSLIWIKIKTDVNEKGPEKTKQLKDKIRNLKDAYKAARDNSKKTGASPMYSPSFEDFDEVLGTRDVISTPFAREVGVLNKDDISDDGGKGNLILFRIYFSGQTF